MGTARHEALTTRATAIAARHGGRRTRFVDKDKTFWVQLRLAPTASGWKMSVVNHTTAIFRQIDKDTPRTHHDALEFPDGRMVLLTDVLEGQEATVLQLPAQPITVAEIKTQERVRHVG
jgi:hypothetical protein